MKKPSDATLLRHCKRDLNVTKGALELCKLDREQYRSRATRAEQEVAEWKRRFDDLLRLRPALPATPQGLEDQVRAMLVEPRDTSLYISAIKLVREKTNMGLKEAKDYVDGLKSPASTPV